MTRERRIHEIGRELLARARRERSPLSLERASSALLVRAWADEEAKRRLFRFIDVLPALPSDADVARHLEEYFAGRAAPFPRATATAVRVARSGPLGERAVAALLRAAVRALARRFIAGTTPDEAIRAVERARAAGIAFTLDVLGEACVSDEEADAYERRYLRLIEALGARAARWPARAPLDAAPWGALPRVNISVKLSALDPHLDPGAPRVSADRVLPRLRAIVRAAQAHGAHIQIDMEERRLEPLTLTIFRELATEPEFQTMRALGVVLQAYLRDAEATARELIAWARRRGTPITVRLVKGAYWDYETAHAALEGWAVPVYQAKGETDASFERLTRLFLESADAVDLAVASHNVRSIAHALATREELAVPPHQLEFQLLYGMATPLARALVARGERARVYMPFGELIPGMGYLVRRLLENTSNESFLRRGFVEDEPVEELLADPAPRARGVATAAPAPLAGAPPGFRNEPHADPSEGAARERFAAALAAVHARLGRRYPLVIDGRPEDAAEEIVSRNPSRPSEIIGRAASASADDVDRAVAAARRAFPAWRDRGAAARAADLGRAAELMRRRRDELAAWVVYEAGKPWREADADVAEAIDFVEYYRRAAIDLERPVELGGLPGEINHYAREPRGVAGVIAPWNFPLAILTGLTTAALATGNTVVMKPAEQTPIIAAKLVELLLEAGVPPGVVNFVPGMGEIAGDRVVTHPDVDLIAFTGSREVGMHIYAAAAQAPKGARRLKRVVAEMGGKNAVIVDDDADLDEAVQAIVASAFGYAGQKCSACSRVFGVGRVYERLVERVVEATRTLPFGPADRADTVVGPLIDAASVQRLAGYVELGRGIARAALVREVPAELGRLGGHYVAPAIFADVPIDSPLAQEEIFGPLLSLMRAATFEEALARAIDIDYALTGGVFSRSPAHLRRAREAFRVGNLYVNRGITGSLVGRQPFGGRQISGIGYQSGGPDYLLQFVETRVITENTLRRGFTSSELE